MILFALAIAAVLHIDSAEFSAERVNCGQWERIDEYHWRAEAGADVLFDNGKWHHFNAAVDATEEFSPDLADTIEAFCHVEIDEGDTEQR